MSVYVKFYRIKENNVFKVLINNYKTMFKNEFGSYNTSKLIKDVLAGLTVAAVALPLALAFGAASVDISSGALGVVAGLITAIIAGIVTGVLGGGSFQISGPTGAMTVILSGIVGGKYGFSGMLCASFMAGIILLLLGILRFGRVIKFIPRPVVIGFTSGISIVIALGQLSNFFGVSLSGDNIISKLIYFFKYCLIKIDLTTVLCSAAVVVFMAIYPKRLAKYVPSSLIAIIICTVVVKIFKIPVATIGKIPSSIINEITLSFSGFDLSSIKELISPAVTIAALGMIESLLCGTCAAGMKKENFDSDIELIAQGIGNMTVTLFGGVPSTAAMARTSVAIKAGGVTRLTSVFQSAFLLMCVFFLSGIIGMVPYPALAGVLVMTSWKMNDFKTIGEYFKGKHADAIVLYLVTMIATVLLDLTYAILIGVGLSFVLFVIKLTKLDMEAEEDDTETAKVKISGVLFFANEKKFCKKLSALCTDKALVTVDLSAVSYIDLSAAVGIRELLCEAEKEKIKIISPAAQSAAKILKDTVLTDNR